MGILWETFIGIAICIGLMAIAKVLLDRYEVRQKYRLHDDLQNFKKAIEGDNFSEIDRLGKSIANNLHLTTDQLRTIIIGINSCLKKFPDNADKLKNATDAISTRQVNWGLFAHRYTDPEEYAKALEDPINLK